MQKIIMENPIREGLKRLCLSGIYLGLLCVVTHFTYSRMAPLTVLQILFAWLLIYNMLLCFLGTPPVIDNIYFQKVFGTSGEYTLFPYLDGSDRKFSFYMSTELFISIVFSRILAGDKPKEFFLYLLNFSVLAFLLFFWRRLISLLRGIYSYGQNTLGKCLDSQYVSIHEGEYSIFQSAIFKFLIAYAMLAAVFSWGIHPRFESHSHIIASYLYMLYLPLVCGGYDNNAVIKAMIALNVVFNLQLHFMKVQYPTFLFFLFVIMLFLYAITLSAKNALLRETHAYLCIEASNVELKEDINAYIQNVTQHVRFFLYSGICLYLIFIVLLFSISFKWGYTHQFSKILGIDYFLKM